MSKKIQTLVITILVLVLLVSLWMIFYEGRKSNDNLVPLTQAAEMEEAEAFRKLKGFEGHQLVEVWGQPTISAGEELVWKVGDNTVLTVFCSDTGEVVSCRIRKSFELPELQYFRDLEAGQMEQWLLGRYADQVMKVWGKPETITEEQLSWRLPRGGAHSVLTVTVIETGKIVKAVYDPAN